MLKLQKTLTELRKPVTYFTDDNIEHFRTTDHDYLEKIYQSMLDFLYKSKTGVGLAAPQVELSQPIIIICEDGKLKNAKMLINPRFEALTTEMEYGVEGCLSYPGMEAVNVGRFKKVYVNAYEYKNGKLFPIAKVYTKLNARIIQHEIDHLNGLEMFDRTAFEPEATLEKFGVSKLILKNEDVIFVNEPPLKHLYTGEPIVVPEDKTVKYKIVGVKN